uniref:Huntingtin-interacting protein 1 n=1 Tax=Panagrellus redivivus TaxID=6233 RepID=A0A7E4VWV4_PANRE
MSRSALNSQQREAFLKSQISSCHKALNKAEAPLKQKHARILIIGTHKERSANVFWNTVTHIELEKNPIVTWKFCHLLHKIIRDGHRNVTQDSYRFINRLVHLGNFWQHLRTSGYGLANYSYCQLLVKRLEFHHRHTSIPGSYGLNPPQIEALTQEVNGAFELSIELLDHLDAMIELKTSVTSTMDSMRWSSITLPGQCLLAPLVLVILDTSKIYDIIVKMLFKLHDKVPADVLMGHRSRFNTAFHQLKKFYDECSGLQYFQYLVSIPTLPSQPPNFLNSTDLQTYQAPQAYLRGENMSSEGGDTPPDTRSIAEESTIVDLDFAPPAAAPMTPVQNDHRDTQIANLEQEIFMLQDAQRTLINEAKSRIEAYESRLQDLNSDRDYWKERHTELQEESQRFRATLEQNQRSAQDSESLQAKLSESEDKFQKLKGAYTTFRAEHLQALRDIGELTKKSKALEEERLKYEEEVRNLKQELLVAEQDKRAVENKVNASASSVDEMESQLASAQMQLESLNLKLQQSEETHTKAVADLQLSAAQTSKSFFGSLCTALLELFEEAGEDLQNSTSISYPSHLIANALVADLHVLNQLKTALQSDAITADLSRILPVFGHRIANTVVNAAAAAYTASIEQFDDVNEVCKTLLTSTVTFVKDLKGLDFASSRNSSLPIVEKHIDALTVAIKKLPTLSGDVNAEQLDTELESEMDRVNRAIADAVQMIEEIQKRSRQSATGARLEVNDKILDSCNDLIAAIRILVARSRDVQEEIVKQGGGNASPREFYKRNHQWTEGLLSAAKAVGAAATYLVQSADGVVSKTGKFESLIIAAQEVGASVAQLYVSSRVKADKNSTKMAELGSASKTVNKCTAGVVATVKAGQLDLADENLDFTNLSLHEAKKREMESQVRTLELEAELEKERKRFAALRKEHYHLASLVSANQEQNGN